MKRIFAALAALLLLAVPSHAEPSAVSIVPGSEINLVARDGRIPVTIKNESDLPQTVVLHGTTTTFRLEVLGTTEVTIPAGSSQLAELPVRAIANGPVQLRVWVEQDNVQLGDSVNVDINVNYDIELFLLVSFGFAMFALIVVGIFRTVLKFKRRPNG